MRHLINLVERANWNPLSDPKFRAWFGESNLVDEHGIPLVFFHGTGSGQDIAAFRTGKELKKKERAPAIYFTTNPEYASNYAGQAVSGNQPAIYPVYLRGRIFDPSKEADLNALFSDPSIRRVMNDGSMVGRLKAQEYQTYIPKGNCKVLEQPRIQNALKRLGYDGYMTNEVGKMNVAIFDPSNIKSVYNAGSWNPDSPRISENA